MLAYTGAPTVDIVGHSLGVTVALHALEYGDLWSVITSYSIHYTKLYDFSRRDTHFRISYAAADETIERGVEILRRLAKQP